MEKSMPFRIEYRREQPPQFLSPRNANTSDLDKPDDSSNSNCRSNKRKVLPGGRFWSEEDEIRILETLLDSFEEYGTTVFDDAFFNRVEVLLCKSFERTQLRDKIKKMKTRYNKNMAGGCGVEGVSVSHHNRVVFNLSDKVWGHGDLAMRADGSVVKVMVGKKDEEDDALGSKEDDVSLELLELKNEKSEMEDLETPTKEESSFERSNEKQGEDKKNAPTDKDVSSYKKEKESEKERSKKLTEEPLSSSSYSCMDKKNKKKRKKRKSNKKIKEEEKDNDGKETKQVPSNDSYPFLHELFGQIEERHGLQGIARIASQNIAPKTAVVVEKKLQRIFNARLKLEMKRQDIVNRVLQFVKDLKES